MPEKEETDDLLAHIRMLDYNAKDKEEFLDNLKDILSKIVMMIKGK